MEQTTTELQIRHVQQEDMPLLGELYQSVTSRPNAIFWWIGEEANWSNVYCAFEHGKMVAKGQVGIINIVPPGRDQENKHAIYVNIKAIPEREHDYVLLDRIYELLYARAVELKATLPTEYGTRLCVGNNSTEVTNNQFFLQRGFRHLISQYHMERMIEAPIPELQLPETYQFSHWNLDTSEEAVAYLDIDTEIWPDNPLGLERLNEFKQYPLWTSMVVRQGDTVVAGLLIWKEDETAHIDNVFVREQWRGQGLAKFLLAQALQYAKSHDIPRASLEVLTDNRTALQLYESLGFEQKAEEIRYCIEL
ncbi:GNAT family N-acetyltransferase [Paenibacillus popilliae]|uniref:GNAT family N-acetyltransferase n=1 Tax=Paenibacillus popilliae TaxID=78057 RepID=A0ABY3AHV5_PAEPP|nr:GNAT family N-acetyltransferase [Paenibacillus sp. SDF0028]TQR40544.1 GNAT family N-acetyltransferase [Paenibacillus sp. SDF0028]